MRDTPSPHPLRVLLVDDSKDARETLRLLLLAWGHQVRLACDGPSALQECRTFHPQAVLLDIGLPGTDGWQVARRIRQEGSCPGAVLVALTGYGSDQDQVRSRQAGFDLHLTKPAEPAALRHLLACVRSRFALA